MPTFFWRLFLPVTALVLGSIVIFGLSEIDRELTVLRSREKLNVGRGAGALSRSLETITRDLNVLAGHSALRAALDSPTTQNLNHLAEDFANVSRSKGIYDQLRWIDESGMERVRIDYVKGRAVVVPPDQLQNKSQRYYFIDSFRLEPGEIYVSPLDLNIEQDKIEVPYKPMLRLATPVADSRGAKRGIVIINCYGGMMLDSFAGAATDIADHAMMVNSEGYWLRSPKAGDEWGFMFNRPDLSLAAQAPAAWEEIRSADSGQEIFADGLWTWESVYPLAVGQKSSTGAAGAFAPSLGEVTAKRYVWKSVAHLPDSTLSAIRRAIWLKLATAAALLLALFGFGSWKLARAWAALATSEEDVRRLNAGLERQVDERTKALRESDARYRKLFDRNPLPILAVDKETLRFLTINQTAIEHYGYSREEFLAMTIVDLQVPEDRARVEAELREQYARGPDEIAHHVRRHVTKGGRIIFADITAQPLNIGDRRARLISVSDVTERNRVEQELRKLSRAIEQSPVSVVITDPEGRIEYVNPMFTEVTGYSAAEAIGQNPRILRSGEASRELYDELWKAITSGVTWRGEFHNRRKNGTLFWERASISPIVDRDGRISHYIAVKEDITERKRHEDELRRLNEDLERRVEERTHALHVANRELQAFSYSVSHDLRAPLRAISGFSQMIEDGYGAQIDEHGRELLTRVRAAAQRMGCLIDDLLKLSQISWQSMRIRTVDLSALAKQAAEELQAAEPERRVEWVIAPGVTAEGDEGLLSVVLQNLIGNAWKYSSKREAARIEFGVTEEGNHRVYFVRDNGAGFDMIYANKLFVAFQRLHSHAEFPGTGVGLATVARIIHRHGGEVRAEGHRGEGACFYFTLGASSRSD